MKAKKDLQTTEILSKTKTKTSIDLKQHFSETLHCLLGNNLNQHRYLIAVSGGVDSVVLLHLIANSSIPRQNIVVGHLNHGLRSTANRDELTVKQLAKGLGLDLVIGRLRNPRASETWLRQRRLAFYKKVMTQKQCNFVMTAHHLDDQLETFFLRLFRGTSALGLGGMQQKHGRRLKPLLSIVKQDLYCYAEENNLPFFEDETNLATSILRNRVRHELLPTLIQLTAPLYGDGLAFKKRMFRLLSELSSDLNRPLPVSIVRTSYFSRFSALEWKRLDPSSQRLFLRRILRSHQVYLQSGQLDELVEGLVSRSTFRYDRLPHLWLSLEKGNVFFQNRFQRKRWLDLTPQHYHVTTFEKSTVLDKLEFRFLQAGDRFEGKKIKDLSLPVPAVFRPKLLVLAYKAKQELRWVYPQPSLSFFKVSPPWGALNSISPSGPKD